MEGQPYTFQSVDRDVSVMVELNARRSLRVLPRSGIRVSKKQPNSSSPRKIYIVEACVTEKGNPVSGKTVT